MALKPYRALTHRGRLRRIRCLAQQALAQYGMAGAQLTFVHQAGNTMYRVAAPDPASSPVDHDLFAPDRFLLRIHQPGYQTPEGIELELAWLEAMRCDAGLPVPEPVRTLESRLLVQVSIPGIPGPRHCSLLRWVKGRMVTRGVRADHYRAQGRLMGRMHKYAAQWQPPPGLTKRHWDWDGFFSAVEGTDLTADDIWPLLPAAYVEPFQAVTRRVRAVMDEWGTGSEVYGLIHADLGIDANLLFWRGEARAIDFDDSGFGYWIYDLAIALEHCRDDGATYALYRGALLEGYTQTRPLPTWQATQLDLFLAAWDVYLSLWAAAGAHLYPHHRAWALERLERAAAFVLDYVTGTST